MLPLRERDNYVASACGDDPELLDELRSLLDHDTPDESLFYGAVIDAMEVGGNGVAAPDSAEGQLLGPWLIGRELGRGGTANVYLAVRAEGEYRKQAAVKVIRRGMDTALVVAASGASGASWPRSNIPTSHACWMAAPRPADCRVSRWNMWKACRSIVTATNGTLVRRSVAG